jgi:hypothetical protein
MATVKTFQDLQAVGNNEQNRMKFVHDAIEAHKGSEIYRNAIITKEYDRQQNRTITWYQKLLYKVTGEVVPDNYSANFKLCSNFYHRLTTQLTQYLLGNGASWGRPTREVSAEAAARHEPASDVFQEEVWDEELEAYVPHWFIAGTDRKVGLDFDQRLQEVVQYAMDGSVSFGFWNNNHVEVFDITEFVPLYDEENGALMAGIRFWQVASDKPLRATLYEIDGYTDYVWHKSTGSIKEQKRPYKLVQHGTTAEGTVKYDGENYEGFPIVPCWQNKQRTGALVGMRENIDAYDLIKSGFCNDVDDASLIYWIISNANGMDEIDEAQFVDSLKRTHVALLDSDGAHAEAHTHDVPVEGRETILDRLRADMYDDFMALDPKTIAGGAITATQIEAAYEPMNERADELEFCVLDFLQGILKIAGIKDKATFTRSVIVNKAEEVDNVLKSAEYYPEEYTTQKLLTIMGDADKFEEVQRLKQNDDIERNPIKKTAEDTEEPDETEEQE